MLTYDKNFIMIMLQLTGKFCSFCDGLAQIQNVYSYIETLSLSTITISPTFIDIKDQLRSNPWL